MVPKNNEKFQVNFVSFLYVMSRKISNYCSSVEIHSPSLSLFYFYAHTILCSTAHIEEFYWAVDISF